MELVSVRDVVGRRLRLATGTRPAAAVLALVLMMLVATPALALRREQIEPGLVAVLGEDGAVSLEALPLGGEGMLAMARRLCGDSAAATVIGQLNGGPRVLAGVRYRVPFTSLTAALQLKVLRTLFPDDTLDADGWHHRVTKAGLMSGENLWALSDWFTGRGESFGQIREANRLRDDQLQPGSSLWVPAALLRPALRSALPAAGAPAATLEYRREGDKRFAVYKLQPGEALYSSVVVRFTGRVFAEDVNALAQEIAKASGIEDVTDIPIGYEVKIPFGLLLPEYLPADDPRRREYEASVSDSNRFSNEIKSQHLDGITVVLDAGHGGSDAGATKEGVWESLYVYDIMLRTKRALETRTAARVIPTVREGDDFDIPDQDVLPYSRGRRVLTTPPYPIEDAKVGVNLRWYLSNSAFRHAVDHGIDPKKVVFVSIHADSLHPSLRGAMIYIPSADMTGGRSGRSGPVYAARREVREQQWVEFSWHSGPRAKGCRARWRARRSLPSPSATCRCIRSSRSARRSSASTAPSYPRCCATTRYRRRCWSRSATSPTATTVA